MVDADEHVRDDETALRQVGSVGRQRHGRLELRDVVVAEVAHDRILLLLCVVEGDETGAAADERVAAEPALLHRFEQERRRAEPAQAQVRAEGCDEVGRDVGGCVHVLRNEKTFRLEGLANGAG